LVSDLFDLALLIGAKSNQGEVFADGEGQVEIPWAHHAPKALWQPARSVGRGVAQVAFPMAAGAVGETNEKVRPDRTPEEGAWPRLSTPLDKALEVRLSGHGSSLMA
jgi:hypothetical protein